MISRLLNPFTRIAGIKSLLAGIIIISATAFIGYTNNTHFPDIISIKTCPELPVWYFILQSFSNWFVFSALLYLCAVVASSSSIRIVDIFGTQALARFPYLLASLAGYSDSVNKFGNYILWTTLQKGEPISLSTVNFVVAISIILLSFLLTIWMVTLMYNAFKVSANLKGPKAIVIFIVVFIISMVIAIIISHYLFNKFS
jgi:hypothetical protein